MGYGWVMWIAVAMVAFSCALVAAAIVARRYQPAGMRRWLVASRQSGRLARVMAVVLPLAYLVMMAGLAWPFGGSVYIRVLSNVPMALMFAGIQFFELARRPTGSRVKCSLCGYDLSGLAPGTPRGTAGEHDARCPECGGQWGWRGGAEHVQRRWDRRYLLIAALLLAPLVLRFASIPTMGLLWWDEAMLRLAPTGALVEEVLTQKSFRMAAWAALGTRTLTAGQTDRIARHILLARAGTYIGTDEVNWLTRAMLAKTIDPKLIEPQLARAISVKIANSGKGATLKPDPNECAPFAKLELWMMEVRGGGSDLIETGEDSPTALILRGAGAGLFQTYTINFDQSALPEDGTARRKVAILLQPPGIGKPTAAAFQRVSPGTTWLYRADIVLEEEVGKDR